MNHMPSPWRLSNVMRWQSSSSASGLLCRANLQTSSSAEKQRPWLLVGLGNPYKVFEGTRHNVGFETIDALAEAECIRLSSTQHKALIGRGVIGSSQVLLAKPQTFVNASGESVGPLATYYRIPIQQVLVICDDMDLEFAAIRLLPKGGHGGHNGMRSVIQHLKGSQDFPRLKIGIGRPPGKMDPGAFVIRKFSKAEREELDVTIARATDVIRQVVLNGVEKACSTCNEPRKGQSKTRAKGAVQSA